MINIIFQKFGSIDYRVNSPEGNKRGTPFQVKLLSNVDESLNIDFTSLSSGEKIIIALVSSVYKAKLDKNFPNVLLLDEVDSSLHPSMIKNLLDVIQKTFIEENNVRNKNTFDFYVVFFATFFVI